jgi:hypothetical protein
MGISAMRRVMFVVTTQANMGDLALCQEWINDLGRIDFRFAFVLAPNLNRFIDPQDERFFFQPTVDVGATIAAAAANFRPDAVIVASNSFWNIPNQRGAAFGRFPDDLYGLGVPLLSFDPLELGFRIGVPFTKYAVEFPAIPPTVWRLRYMSRSSIEPNARHFCTRQVFEQARARPREEILKRWGGDPAKRTVIFPFSSDRFRSITDSYPLYYHHLGRLFSHQRLTEVQFMVVTPHPAPGLQQARNVVHVPHVPFPDFLGLIAASDVYLSDSVISCMFYAHHLTVPAMLLMNSAKSAPLAPGSFFGNRFFPYKVFPIGFMEVCDELIDRWEISGCFIESEVLDIEESAGNLDSLLSDTELSRQVRERTRAWRQARLSLPRPRQTLEEILEK